jgi:nucleoside-diphosphate-sugar epimerase
MRIVITGATGYIGTKLTKRLRTEGHKLYAVVREESNTGAIADCVEKIITSKPYESLADILKTIKPEVYINLAGYYCGTHTYDKIAPLFDANVILPTYVMDAAVSSGCRYIIHTASVQQCYNGEEYNPINLYAATKQAFEDIIYYYTAAGRTSAITLQLFDTYGADDIRRKVFNLVRMVKDGESIEMSPGMQKLYFCYIDDVIDAYVRALELIQEQKAGFCARYAVRENYPIELKEFIEKYLRESGRKIKIQWGARPYMEKEIMDPQGIGKILSGWYPKISYDEGIKMCAEYDSGRKG